MKAQTKRILNFQLLPAAHCCTEQSAEPERQMPKRDRQPEHWGSLVPHNSMHGRRPVPLSRSTVVIGKGGDVRAPSNPHLSRHHIRLEREGDGSVYATHLSALNSTWLNGKRLEHDRRTLVEPCACGLYTAHSFLCT